MYNCIGGPVLLPDGTLNPNIAKYCEVTTVEQRYGEALKIEMVVREPINMDTTTRKLLSDYWDLMHSPKKTTHRERDLVERVVHNPPATIVFWKDKTKTVVKQQDGDVYDPEHGFMAACTKKLFGNDNQFNYEIKWYVPKREEADPEPACPVEETLHDEAIEQIEEATPEADAAIKEFANVMFGGTYSGPTC